MRHLNMGKAIDRFVASVGSLSRLPLMTDADMLQVYGTEVMESSAEMVKLNHEAGICSKCTKRCCPLVRCELYDASFSQCPVYDYRPAICRMHFCDKFSLEDSSFVKEYADIYINSLLEAKLEGSLKVDLFDSPPFVRYAPGFLATVKPYLDSFKTGSLKETEALRLINVEAEQFRTPRARMEKITGTINKELETALAEARLYFKGH